MDKKTILAFILSFAILVGWSLFFGPKNGQTPDGQDHSIKEIDNNLSEVPKASVSTPPHPGTSPLPKQEEMEKAYEQHVKEIEIDTPLYRAVFSNVGPTIKSFSLKKYRQTTDPDSPPIDLVSLKEGMGDFLRIDFSTSSTAKHGDTVFQVDQDAIRLGPDSAPRDVVFSARAEKGLLIVQTFRFYPDTYRIDLRVEATNEGNNNVEGTFSANIKGLPPKEGGSYYSYAGLALLLNGKLEELEIEEESDNQLVKGRIEWIAYEDNYFISAIVPSVPERGIFKGRMMPSGVLEGTYLQPAVSISPLGQQSSLYEFYLGPRDLGVLKEFGKNLGKAINFGWTDIIAKPLLYILRFFYTYIHNYGVSIILLTILVKILFWPLTHKSYKSMKEMQKLQPRMAKLREKHKGDKQKLNQEMMALYKTYKVNPMGGCLPMIVQIPVFFALFRVLGNCIELRHAPFVFWMKDLSAPDRLFHFPFSIPFMTPPYGIPVLTLLMGASMFIQQKMTPTPGDPSQAKIMMFMPVIFTFMFINFPSGLVLYWLVNNILSIGQQYRIHRGPA